MILSLCNEVLREHNFPDLCRMAAGLGYQGLEIAPFTLADDPFLLSDAEIAALRRIVEDHGLVVTGLHWLLVAPKGLSITSGDASIKAKTGDLIKRLIEICGLFGGGVLVHGSPEQRALSHAHSPMAARANATELLTRVASWAQQADVLYCIEPLGTNQTDFINTIDEAIDLVDIIGSSHFKTMIDTASAGVQEPLSVAETIRKYWPTGKVAHIQLNDTNLRAPGQGENRFFPVFQALRDVGYDGVVAVEPFIYEPDGPTTAAIAAGYVRGILETL